jgi:hypothetical protein
MNQSHHPGCRCRACVNEHLTLGLAEAYAALSPKTRAMLAALPRADESRRRKWAAAESKALFPGCTP